jgi:CheY-like chemotaxis protein
MRTGLGTAVFVSGMRRFHESAAAGHKTVTARQKLQHMTMRERRLADLHILVLEDEAMVSMLIEGMLEDLGCASVKTAMRQEEALHLIQTEAIDLAILDVNLNGHDSYPVADALEARKIPFLFSTGYERESLRERYCHKPVLEKPFSGEDLAKILRTLVSDQSN